MTRRQKGIPIYNASQPARPRRLETGTYIMYILAPSRKNVPALRAANRAVRTLINRRRSSNEEELVLEVPEPMTPRQAIP